MISSELIRAILGPYRLSVRGIHGPVHWARVLENGQQLVKSTDANLQVVELFAVFHDACRHNDDHDPKHGDRGAELAALWRGQYFELPDAEFAKLKVACRLHTEGQTQADVTVQTCWDADRLDLGRVGVKPYHKYLCTNAAKNSMMLEWAHERAISGFRPAFVEREWFLRQPISQ